MPTAVSRTARIWIDGVSRINRHRTQLGRLSLTIKYAPRATGKLYSRREVRGARCLVRLLHSQATTHTRVNTPQRIEQTLSALITAFITMDTSAPARLFPYCMTRQAA